MSTHTHAVVGEFESGARVLAAAQAAYAQGFRRMDAFTPYPVEGLAEALGMRGTLVPLFTLLGGIAGALTAYGMQLYSAAWDYRLNVGGRPPHSWPSFVPITFELTVLFAAITALVSMLVLNGLPRPHHPIFETPHFEERNASHFYLAIEVSGGTLEIRDARGFLEQQKPGAVWEVEA